MAKLTAEEIENNKAAVETSKANVDKANKFREDVRSAFIGGQEIVDIAKQHNVSPNRISNVLKGLKVNIQAIEQPRRDKESAIKLKAKKEKQAAANAVLKKANQPKPTSGE